VDSRLVPLPPRCLDLLRPVRRRICSPRGLRFKFRNASYTGCRSELNSENTVNLCDLTGVTGGDHAGALEVAVVVVAPIGLVICVHHERSMGLHVVGVKTPATALDRLTVHEATGVVDVVLQGSCICTSLGHTPLPSARG